MSTFRKAKAFPCFMEISWTKTLGFFTTKECFISEITLAELKVGVEKS